MRARRSIAAGLLTAAAFSSTAAGLAITATLDKASASPPVSPPVSPPQNPNQNGQNLDDEVNGAFNGTGTFTFGTRPCLQIEESFDATYKLNHGKGTGSFSVDGCATFPSATGNSSSLSGSFALTAPDGATLQGAATGSLVGGVNGNPFLSSVSLTLTPTSGTNEFAHVSGAITLNGLWTTGQPGPFNGSLSGALRQ